MIFNCLACPSPRPSLAASDLGYVVTGYRAIDDILRLDDKLKMPGEEIVNNLEVENMPIIEQGYQTLWRFVEEIIEERGANAGKGDLLDEMIAANTAGTLSCVELRQLLILLFAAGYDTTKNLMILLMHSLLQYPEIYRRCAGDASYVKKVVKEQMRFATPSNTMRSVTETFEYREVLVPRGTMLVFPLSLSGRDPAVFSEPNRFNPERTETSASLGFGRGMHLCLGMFLAVANVEEGFQLITERIRNPRLVGDVNWKLFPGVWGITSLPIAFD